MQEFGHSVLGTGKTHEYEGQGGNEPRCEKSGLQGFRPCSIQIGLYSHRRWLEA